MEGVDLIAVQQVTKLFYGRLALRYEDPAKFTGVISQLKGLYREEGIALVDTCRPSGCGFPIPMPEGVNFLRYTANIIVYLRVSGGPWR